MKHKRLVIVLAIIVTLLILPIILSFLIPIVVAPFSMGMGPDNHEIMRNLIGPIMPVYCELEPNNNLTTGFSHQDKCYEKAGVYRKSLKICDKAEELQWGCYIEISRETRNPDICGKINSIYLDDCYYALVSDIGENEVEDSIPEDLLCYKIQSESKKEDCLDTYKIKIVLKHKHRVYPYLGSETQTKDRELCETISTNQSKHRCNFITN